MPAILIADTNVFYNLASGNLKLADICAPGESLHYSPVSVLELTSKLSDKSHSERRDAAKAILDSGAQQFPDPESFLTQTFGYKLTEQPFDFSHAVKAIADSKNMRQLRTGVADYTDQVKRRVSVGVAASWRQTTEGKWVADLLSIMRREIPGFAMWYDPDPTKRKGQVPRLRGQAKKTFLATTQTQDWLVSVISACQHRAFFKADPSSLLPANKAAVKVLTDAVGKVDCYACVYTQYLVRLLTEGALPKSNDSGDTELFIYSIDDDHVVVTSEKLWPRLAKQAGYDQRVRKVM